MLDTYSFDDSIRQSAMERVVKDGNLIQNLIFKLDVSLSTNELDEARKNLDYLGTILGQIDSNLAVISLSIDEEG